MAQDAYDNEVTRGMALWDALQDKLRVRNEAIFHGNLPQPDHVPSPDDLRIVDEGFENFPLDQYQQLVTPPNYPSNTQYHSYNKLWGTGAVQQDLKAGQWHNLINPALGIIIGTHNYKHDSTRHWSDVIYFSWKEVDPAPGSLSKLRFMAQPNSAAAETEELIKYVYGPECLNLKFEDPAIHIWTPPPARARLEDMTPQQQAFCAVLHTVNVRGLPRLLTDFANDSGGKNIVDIRTYYYQAAWSILVTMTEPPPPPQPARRRCANCAII